jgi:hypothetical protein
MKQPLFRWLARKRIIREDFTISGFRVEFFFVIFSFWYFSRFRIGSFFRLFTLMIVWPHVSIVKACLKKKFVLLSPQKSVNFAILCYGNKARHVYRWQNRICLLIWPKLLKHFFFPLSLDHHILIKNVSKRKKIFV